MMIEIDEVIKKNKISGVFLKSGEFVVDVEYVDKFLSLMLKVDFAVLGFEGFYINDEKEFFPNIENIADFSSLVSNLKWDDFKIKSICAARRVLLEMIKEGSSNGFCFVLIQEDEYPHFVPSKSGYESRRYDKYSGKMKRELQRMAREADARGDLPEYGERMREIANTYKKRADGARHKGGRRN